MRKSGLFLCLLLAAGTSPAGSAKLFKTGNRALAEGRFEDAARAYMEAAREAPETAEIQYNLGHAQYQANLFTEASGSYEFAAALAQTDALRGQCWYNVGNCMVKMAKGLRKDNPQMAGTRYLQAAHFYRTALDCHPGLSDAAYNLEIAQRFASEVEKQIREQKDKQRKEEGLIEYIREKLTEFISRQNALFKEAIIDAPQQELEKEVQKLAETIAGSGLHTKFDLPDGTKTPGALQETYEHTVVATKAMAVPDQFAALRELTAALNAMPKNPERQNEETDENSEHEDDSDTNDEKPKTYEDGNPFGDFSEYKEIRGMPPPNKTEIDILTEEIQNQEQRKKRRSGQYKSVEKDW